MISRDEHLKPNGQKTPPPIQSIVASSVTTKEVQWEWRGRIPKGKLTMLDGDPDLGKSVVTVDIAARKSTGRSFPDDAPCEAGNVLIVNVEDGIEDTIVPRLKAHGADLERVRLLATIPDGDGSTRLLEIPKDVPALEREVIEHYIDILIIDPILTMLGGDANKDQDARKALAPLRDMAERTNTAVICVRHLNKQVGLKAIQRGGGNMGLIGVARAGAFFAEHPEVPGHRIMAPHKSNLAEKPPSLVYKLVNSATHGNVPRVEWLGKSEYDANSLAADAMTPHEKSELQEAKDFLRTELSGGPMWAKVVYKDAHDAGIAPRTLERAKTALRVRSQKIGTDGWKWSLLAKDRQEDGVGDVGDVGDVGAIHQALQAETPYLLEGRQDRQGRQGDAVGDLVGDVQTDKRHSQNGDTTPQKMAVRGKGSGGAALQRNANPSSPANLLQIQANPENDAGLRASTPSPGGRRLTVEEADGVRRLIREGMSPALARAVVLGDES